MDEVSIVRLNVSHMKSKQVVTFYSQVNLIFFQLHLSMLASEINREIL